MVKIRFDHALTEIDTPYYSKNGSLILIYLLASVRLNTNHFAHSFSFHMGYVLTTKRMTHDQITEWSLITVLLEIEGNGCKI